jgi:hypothetical protein
MTESDFMELLLHLKKLHEMGKPEEALEILNTIIDKARTGRKKKSEK